MELNKIVAKTELEFIGGEPKVTEFLNQTDQKKIDILKCVNASWEGVQTCATIGLNSVDIGLISNGSKLRVEVLGVSDVSVNCFENILATTAFEIMDSQECFPGHVVQSVVREYLPDCEMQHILLTDPFLWEGAKSIVVGDICVAWLLMVPISDQEFKYAQENGVDALEALLEEKSVDVCDIYRESVV